MKRLASHAVMLAMAIFVSCGGDVVEISGMAYNARLGPIIEVGNRVVYVQGREWPDDLVGKTVMVKGRLRKVDDMPVYLVDGSGLERSGVKCFTKEEMEIK